ncbi:PREDICTED: uncharacterized protein LOC104747425 isoform X2 [Camelina sativa]|nr:PREDICTED: uncharacterized protein LOC104747425 isoform X2 [Camelina sativa]
MQSNLLTMSDAISSNYEIEMMEIRDKGPPPGDPPDTPGTWVRKATGGLSGDRPSPEGVIPDDYVTERLRVEFPDGHHGEPVITIHNDVLVAMNGLWKQYMIVKVLGQNVPLPVLSRKFWELWKLRGGMTVLDLPRQFFIIRFEVEEEYMAAVIGGPWKAFGSYLMVQAWSPSFDPLTDDIFTTPVWNRLSHIPFNLYHRSILLGIAGSLGKPIRIDPMTLNVERARFARICVEVDLRNPLKMSVVINGERYFVMYEGLTNTCSGCGVYGHLVHGCPQREPEKEVVAVSPSVVRRSSGRDKDEDGFTVVRRSGNRSEKKNKRVSFSAGNLGGGFGRNLQEIPTVKESARITV